MILNGIGPLANTGVTLLWENPDPTVSFDEQTIAIDTNAYSVFYVSVAPSTTLESVHTNMVVPNLDREQSVWCCAGVITGYMRKITFDETGMHFSSGMHGTSTTSYNTAYAIPYRIYGVR